MLPQALGLRPIRWTDLPTLRHWRGIPDTQKHLRHPKQPNWLQQIRWFLRIRKDPTCRVFAVTLWGKLVGQAGFYYRVGDAAEVSVLAMQGEREDFEVEHFVVRHLLPEKAREWGLTHLWAEVLGTAPLLRHYVFPQSKRVYGDRKSTFYRWSV